ncbi:MAG: histone deacetylase [Sorangiineae bacterium]|nr:histone deacetylase [Polyangiaceae bacterium]MEB2321961.1 histone deacetylase [Sorangiineae bacterium]
MKASRWKHRLRAFFGARGLPVFYDPTYRLPLASIEAATGMEPRRADLALGYLLETGVIRPTDVRTPHRIRYKDLARVHTHELLDSLSSAEELGRIFAVDATDVNVDELVRTLRVACGGTLDAARAALARGGATLNLLGGFHHAGPGRGGGFCAVNDVATAVAALRAEGFDRRVGVLDLDAHPPDGLAECFEGDPSVWIGSLSGADWGALPGVDETRLPPGCDDASYLSALGALLRRMPPAALTFVLAGGDVLAGDRFGAFALSLDGARRRDLRVTRALAGGPSVWLPAGGYSEDAWKVLAGTGLALALGSLEPVPPGYDALRARFARIAAQIDPRELDGGFELTEEDVLASLGRPSPKALRLLDYYTKEGLEYAFSRYGLLEQLRRLGYSRFRFAISREGIGDCLRVFGRFGGAEHLLIECVVEKRSLGEDEVLYVHWLTLRHPRGRFSDQRPKLPGQEEPGLGLARECAELLARMAARLGLAGLAYRPAWYHTAYAGRYDLAFVEPARQGRWEAILRDFSGVPLRAATLALTEGRVRMNGAPYSWEADEMVHWLDGRVPERGRIEAERARVRFEIVSPSG